MQIPLGDLVGGYVEFILTMGLPGQQPMALLNDKDLKDATTRGDRQAVIHHQAAKFLSDARRMARSSKGHFADSMRALLDTTLGPNWNKQNIEGWNQQSGYEFNSKAQGMRSRHRWLKRFREALSATFSANKMTPEELAKRQAGLSLFYSDPGAFLTW